MASIQSFRRTRDSDSMKTVQKSVLIWYSARQMYDLVVDVPKYPEFLPWCDRAEVVEQHDDGVTAKVGLAFGGMHQSFTTRNMHVPGEQVRLQLVAGPFSKLDGVWQFSPVGADAADESGAKSPAPGGGGSGAAPASPVGEACRVNLNLNYGFDNFALSALIGPVFDKIARTLVEAFVKRAEQVYGKT